MNIKRYDLEVLMCGSSECDMVEDVSGEYVKYDDLVEVIKNVSNAIKTICDNTQNKTLLLKKLEKLLDNVLELL